MLNHCLMREQERKKKQISIQEKVQNEVFYYWGRLQRTGTTHPHPHPPHTHPPQLTFLCVIVQ
jgi:hypothetical protein